MFFKRGNLGTPQNSPGAQFLNVQQSSQIPSDWLLGRPNNNNNNNNNNMNNNIHVSVSVKQFPIAQECCQKPFSPGIGEYAIPRWYYEGRSGICQIYLYRGFGGAGNNFRSQEECQKICKEVHANAAAAAANNNNNNNNVNIANGPAPHIIIPDNSDTNVLLGFGQLQPQQTRTVNIPNIAAYTTTFSPMPQFIVRTTSPQTPSIEIVLPPFPTVPPSSSAILPSLPLQPRQPQQPQFRPSTAAAPLPPPPPPSPPPLDPCSQERDQGVGALQLPRYFFNKETKLCEQFIFFGSASNRNNFNSLEECQNQCPESPNPCAYGTTTTLMSCAPGSVLTQTCSGQQFCHVGATPQTTVCCNKPATNIDRCSQPLNVGVGNSNLQRWYFNPLNQQCQPCFYKGLQGNENNFLSRQDCENSCAINPCKRGVPYRSQGITVQCSATNQAICPAGYYCHVGADSSTSVCCQALVSNPCNEILSKGEGNAALTRFYYDAEKRQCLPFNYLGTKGNTNNFLTKESCEELCPVWVNPCAKGEPLLGPNSKPIQCHQRQPCQRGYYCHIGYDDETTVCCLSQNNDACTVPMSQGFGPHVMSRWHYDSHQRQCKQFTYKGLRGNENNFLLRDHCEQTCPVWNNPCPAGEPILGRDNKPKQCFPGQDSSCPLTHWCHPGLDLVSTVCCPGRQDPCVLAVSSGAGNGNQQRWHFDMAVKQCKSFVYKGIKGNAVS
uniref:BPTI/Kunitz inhibitor domain-containing protein n=1 Tax=Panagrolaimus superbus TaxID=310955 RepID=A0A914YUY8_9BILA